MTSDFLTPLTARPAGALVGRVRVPGDKSISHRALIIGALAVGESVLSGLLDGDDVLATAAALRALGAEIERHDDGTWRVHGVGVGGLGEPDRPLDLGNSGTGVRLLIGLVASHPLVAFFTGDASLRTRPMARVIGPLTEIGASFITRSGDRLPLAVTGAAAPLPIRYRLPVASAQVKSAVLLAGLNAPGQTTVIEPIPTRDHTENLLRHFGAAVTVDDADGGRVISLVGQPELTAQRLTVPGDPSSAAFLAVAAAIVAGSEVTIEGVGVNPLRAGVFECLGEMGAEIDFTNRRRLAGEPVADLVVRAGALRAIEVPSERAPAMIDEYPILAVAAAFAEGRTVMRGIAELRVKESDRIHAMAEGLEACGVAVEELQDGLIIDGHGGRPPPGGVTVRTYMDHRIAMSFLVLGLAAERPVTVDTGAMIPTSFPGFAELLTSLGADIGALGGNQGGATGRGGEF